MIGKCSFCGTEKEIKKGAYGNICLDCCSAVMEEFEYYEEEDADDTQSSLKPHEIKEKLDEYIVGQEEAKQILSVSVYNHYKRINMKNPVQKTNILLVGPTGSGKTYIMQTLANVLELPFVLVDATSFTEAGYVGEDVTSILRKLYIQADGDIDRAEKGIVYVDEADKMVSKGDGHSSRDVNGTGVQQAFLKMMECGEQSFSMESGGTKIEITMKTDNILFVFGGAFVGLNKIIEKRINKSKSSIGFNSVNEEKDVNTYTLMDELIQSDIVSYGFIPEFVGRIPVITQINQLSSEELRDILVKPKNSIVKQYKSLMKIDGVNLTFDNSALSYIVEEASKKNLGARGLRGIIDKPMNIIMFELPKYPNIKKMLITKDLLDNPNQGIKNILNNLKQDDKSKDKQIVKSSEV